MRERQQHNEIMTTDRKTKRKNKRNNDRYTYINKEITKVRTEDLHKERNT